MISEFESARRRPVRMFVAAGLFALLSVCFAGPASAGPALAVAPFYPVSLSAFTLTPAVGAPIGSVVVLWGNGTATATFDLPGPARRLVFDAQAQPCEGSPRLEVRIDDKAVFGREVAGNGSYAVAGSWAAGSHTLKFRFSNDLVTAVCDRNLNIRSVGWWGPHPQYGALSVYVHQDMDMRVVTFSPPSSGRGSTRAATLWTSGSFTGALDSQAADYLYVRMKATPCEGMPRFSLRIDGVLITEQEVPMPFDGESVFSTAGSWPNATHTVEITHLGDVRTAACDRALDVLSVSLSGRV